MHKRIEVCGDDFEKKQILLERLPNQRVADAEFALPRCLQGLKDKVEKVRQHRREYYPTKDSYTVIGASSTFEPLEDIFRTFELVTILVVPQLDWFHECAMSFTGSKQLNQDVMVEHAQVMSRQEFLRRQRSSCQISRLFLRHGLVQRLAIELRARRPLGR